MVGRAGSTRMGQVSPHTIRLRILKDYVVIVQGFASHSFTPHDPIEDTERPRPWVADRG